MFTAALFVIVKIRKQPRCPSVGEWINCGTYRPMEYYSKLKIKDISYQATQSMGEP